MVIIIMVTVTITVIRRTLMRDNNVTTKGMITVMIVMTAYLQ